MSEAELAWRQGFCSFSISAVQLLAAKWYISITPPPTFLFFLCIVSAVFRPMMEFPFLLVETQVGVACVDMLVALCGLAGIWGCFPVDRSVSIPNIDFQCQKNWASKREKLKTFARNSFSFSSCFLNPVVYFWKTFVVKIVSVTALPVCEKLINSIFLHYEFAFRIQVQSLLFFSSLMWQRDAKSAFLSYLVLLWNIFWSPSL